MDNIIGLLDGGMARARLSNVKKKAVLERIESLEQAILKAKEYLESGKHAEWHQFRPMFAHKVNVPHKDWVKNVFLAHKEKALRDAEKLLGRFN